MHPDISQRGGLIREKQVLKLLPIHRSTLWRWVRQGTFPQPSKVAPGVTAWSKADVTGWLEAKFGEHAS
jgi:prophage regulatory protein